MTKEEKLVQKIRAILAKADENANPSEAERDAAMRTAQRLLLKHGLSMADVEAAGDPAEEGREFVRQPQFDTDGSDEYWQGTLLWAIAPSYLCKVYKMSTGRKSHRWVILGRQENVDALLAMYEWVRPQVQLEFDRVAPRMGLYWRIARRFAIAVAFEAGYTAVQAHDLEAEDLAAIGQRKLQELKDHGMSRDEQASYVAAVCNLDSAGYAKNALPRIRAGEVAPGDTEANLGVWRRTFLDAACRRIGARLQELTRESVEELGEQGNALVVREADHLDEFMESIGLKLSRGGSQRKDDRGAYMAGREAGDRVDVSGHKKVVAGRGQLGSGS